MFHRVPQPPVDAARRKTERHRFWPGAVLTLAGLVFLGAGVSRPTSVDTVSGGPASETQLMKAFTSGGLQFGDEQEPPAPPKPTGNPAVDAAALARWDKQMANAQPVDWTVRVDTTAKDPCPT